MDEARNLSEFRGTRRSVFEAAVQGFQRTRGLGSDTYPVAHGSGPELIAQLASQDSPGERCSDAVGEDKYPVRPQQSIAYPQQQPGG